MSWREYWNSDTPIYVDDRHKSVHYENIARDIVFLCGGRELRVLDFGSGEALSAAKVADASSHLYLCDSSSLVRSRLSARLSGRTDVTILSPEDLEATIAPGSLDLVIANSVVQYLSGEELSELFERVSKLLAPQGRLVVADVVPSDQSPAADAAALLALAWKNGFFRAAVVGLVRTVFSGYLTERAKLGLARYSEADFLRRLQQAGFTAERARPNMGHNQRRMMFVAKPTAAAS